ncbi:probable histone-lysine N-methyltransferase set-23 isoform X2 [Halyomorpha halys]|uniref:probable histone-lysine N-methyltransferase set-23 isoform X2 n=1 Tax=Halyomorpha halys TaxID=286706 RepID=UPI0034D3441A
MFLNDNYRHPISNVNYIKESILGPGGDREAFYSWFETTCSCSEESECTNQSECECISKFGPSYSNGLLATDILASERCVYECSAYCSCGFMCHNRVAQKGPYPHLEIKEAGRKGFGVFSLKSILAGTFIAEYAGEIISKQVAEERFNVEGKNKYILTLREHYSENLVETYLDAYSYGNVSRAFARILCICQDQKLHHRHRGALRAKYNQYLGGHSMVLAPASVTYATVCQHGMYSM